jgi:PKD repeat protein
MGGVRWMDSVRWFIKINRSKISAKNNVPLNLLLLFSSIAPKLKFMLMKKLSLLTVFTLMVGMAFGQMWPSTGPLVQISGIVTDTAGMPVRHVTVAALDTSAMPPIFMSVSSSHTGQYYLSLRGRNGGGTFHLRAVDCAGNIYNNSVSYTNSAQYQRNFTVSCRFPSPGGPGGPGGPNPPHPPVARPCHANFAALPDTGLGVRLLPHMRDNSLTYSWSFGDGNTSSSMLASHQYAAAGTYTVTLVISRTSPACSDTESRVVNIPLSPIVNPPVNNCFSRFDARTDTTLTVSLRARNLDTTATYSWDFGDGSTGTGRMVSHTYAASGVYVVRLSVSNAAGTCSDTSRARVSVPRSRRGHPPIHPFVCNASFRYRTDSLPLSYRFIPRFVNPRLQYTWNYGDGSTGSGIMASHTYAAAGTYVVCLSVADSAGNCSNQRCDTIVVSAPTPNPTPRVAGNTTAGSLTLEAYPNPMSDQLSVVFQAVESGSATVYIYDLAGRMVIERTVTAQQGANKFEMSVTGMVPGSYLMTVTIGSQREWLRLVKR